MFKSYIKRAVVNAARTNIYKSLGASPRHRHIPVFTLHRFDDPENGLTGHHPEMLRRALSYLIENGYNVISMDDLIHAMSGETYVSESAVVFTFDDSFYEQASIAAPIFREVDFPATIFLTTDFSSIIKHSRDYARS